MSHQNFYRFSSVIILSMTFNFLIDSVDSSNVLFFNGMGEGSHFSAAAALGEELVSRGHQVTFLISNEFKHLAENDEFQLDFEFIIINTEVLMTPYYEQITQAHFEGLDLFRNWTFTNEVDEARARECSLVFSSSFIANLRNRQFDAIVFDPFWPCCIVLGETLNIKRVVLNPASFNPAFLRAFGLHVNSAFIAEHGTGFPEAMNFFQRIHNVLISLRIPVIDQTSFNDALSTQESMPFVAMLQKNKVTSYMEGLSSADLFMSTSDPLLYPDMPESAGHISVPGLTTKEALPLPEDLETFMQSSGDHGVILLSLGTYVTHMPDKFVTIFREVFSKLPHKVIWQWKDDNSSNMSENIRLMKWLPQNDLLGHDKTKLLIYQGGNNGLHEAIYHGVPLLVIPLGGDQFDVAQRVVDKEIGLKIRVTSLTVATLRDTITTLLGHPKYQRNMNKMSVMFRDRPISPRRKAVFWIEHVLKYGSEHLHSASRELHNLQRNLIDVYYFILLFPCLIIIACIWVSKIIFEGINQLFGVRKQKAD